MKCYILLYVAFYFRINKHTPYFFNFCLFWVLLQEQQQKQLELILAIGKAGKLWQSREVSGRNQHATETTKSSDRVVDGSSPVEPNQTQVTELEPGYQQ